VVLSALLPASTQEERQSHDPGTSCNLQDPQTPRRRRQAMGMRATRARRGCPARSGWTRSFGGRSRTVQDPSGGADVKFSNVDSVHLLVCKLRVRVRVPDGSSPEMRRLRTVTRGERPRQPARAAIALAHG